MARTVTISPFGAQVIGVLLDEDASYSLPDTDIFPPPVGTTYEVFDNLGLGQDILISGVFASGDTISVSGVSGWVMRFTWAGSFYAVG